MALKIDQKAYLQKYLSGPSGDKKKKKKKVTKGSGFKIIDDDLDLSKLRPLDGDELDILGEGEDAPQIAGIIDERPEDVKKLEQFKTTSKWRVINQDDGFNSKLQIEEIKKDIKEAEKENELIFGKMYSDSEDEQKQDPPPRKQTNENQTNNASTKKPLNHSDSDFSPPRKEKIDNHKTKSRNKDSDPLRKKESKSKQRQEKSDSDLSPPRKHEKHKKKAHKSRDIHSNTDSDLSPPRKSDKHKRKESKSEVTQQHNDSDLSPPRKNAGNIANRVRKASRWGDFKEEEERYKKYAQKSPPLYQRSSRSPDGQKTKNKRNKSSDSDMSPPRKTQKYRHRDSDLSPTRKSSKNYDSDLSPPRKRKHLPERQRDSKDRYDNQNSRKSNYTDSVRYSDNRNRNWDDRRSNHSPSRSSKPRKDDKRRYDRQNSDSPPPTNKKMDKTLEGKKAGLQDAVELRQENEAFRKREEEAFRKMTDEVSGRNAQVVSRKGKRETSEDRQKQKEKADKQKELDEKYKKWGKGLKQIEDQEKRVQEFMHEASKPLARHKGDRDLEDRLKDVEREGDPMLKYIREKKRDRGELGPERPSYKGSFPPNRFNIRPGYRWDGVDRSNGYEKKFFDQQSKKKAQAEEAYKWSTEDL